MPRAARIGFELSVSARDDGTLEAAYISLSNAKVDRTQEILEDILLADYASNGKLVGIEILAPVTFSDLIKLIDKPMRPSFQRVVRHAAPEELVLK